MEICRLAVWLQNQLWFVAVVSCHLSAGSSAVIPSLSHGDLGGALCIKYPPVIAPPGRPWMELGADAEVTQTAGASVEARP